MMHRLCLLLLVLTAFLPSAGRSSRDDRGLNRPWTPAHAPVVFTRNMGQWDEGVLFRTASGGATIWITRDGLVYQFTRGLDRNVRSDLGKRGLPEAAGYESMGRTEPTGTTEKYEQLIVRATYAGARRPVEAVGQGLLEYTCNYFLGDDPAQWRTDVPNYSAVVIKEMYPGLSVKYSGDEAGQVTYEILAEPGADPRQFKVQYDHAIPGECVVTDWGYQIEAMAAGERSRGLVSPRLPMAPESGLRSESVPPSPASPSAVGLSYSTYLGGSSGDVGMAIATDQIGTAYVTGYTGSGNFPVQGPFQTDTTGVDIFVTKFPGGGGSPLYSTYLGGASDDYGFSVAVDPAGRAYVTGVTHSTNFPLVAPIQSDQGIEDVFVTRLGSSGNSLSYSTYLGGSAQDYGLSIAVDLNGFAYVTGYTVSTNFPTLSPYQSDQGSTDGFVCKLTNTGGSLLYSTYLGGPGSEISWSIAVDASGNAYVTGQTDSAGFPTLNPIQLHQDSIDAFVTKLSGTGNSLVYSTYLGGTSRDHGYGIALDGSGRAYVAGVTRSVDFPTVNAYQLDQVAEDAFVCRLSSAGTGLQYSTYLGGNQLDEAVDVAVDASGSAYVVGRTASTDFPLKGAYLGDQGGEDAFLTRLSSAGNSLSYSTYFGGSSTENPEGVALDTLGYAYLVGTTFSTNLPVLNGFQLDQGLQDVMVAKFNMYFDVVPDTLSFFLFSPIDMVVTDPAGDSIGIDSISRGVFNTVLNGSLYDTLTDVNSPDTTGPDGEADDRVVIPNPLAGSYKIRIFREPGASDSAHFTTSIRINGNQLLIPDGYKDATLSALDTLPAEIVYTVATTLPGDSNADGIFSAADLIYMVNYVFKGGPGPLVEGHADVNCDGVVTSADIIMMVNFVFKSGPPPCSQTSGG